MHLEKSRLGKQIREYYEKYPQGGLSPFSELISRKREIRCQLKDLSINIFLDTGCGNGELLRSFSDILPASVGIDISSQAIKLANLSLSNNEYVIASVCHLPFRKIFDVVLCSEVIEHVSNYKSAIYELASALKLKGLVIITTPNILNPYILFTSFHSILFGNSRTNQIYDRPIFHKKLLSSIEKNFSILKFKSFYDYKWPDIVSFKFLMLRYLLIIIRYIFRINKYPLGLYLLIVGKNE